MNRTKTPYVQIANNLAVRKDDNDLFIRVNLGSADSRLAHSKTDISIVAQTELNGHTITIGPNKSFLLGMSVVFPLRAYYKMRQKRDNEAANSKNNEQALKAILKKRWNKSGVVNKREANGSGSRSVPLFVDDDDEDGSDDSWC